jgi:vacuolar protein sorting-associated protein 29
VTVTKGDFDDDSSLKETEVVTIGEFRIGVCHGHTVVPWGDAEALASLARRLECDILVTGHTHAATVVEIGGRIIVNPGSMTGAFSATSSASLPSFQLLSLTGHSASVFSYSLRKGKVDVLHSEHVKGGAPPAAAAASAGHA